MATDSSTKLLETKINTDLLRLKVKHKRRETHHNVMQTKTVRRLVIICGASQGRLTTRNLSKERAASVNVEVSVQTHKACMVAFSNYS